MAESTESVLIKLIEEYNRTWTEGRIDDLGALFDERVVAMAPGGAGWAEGREAMVESFRQFLTVAKLESFRPQRPRVDLFGLTAIATFVFDVRYALEGVSYDETASEILVLAKHEDGWKIVWRTQIPMAAAPSGAPPVHEENH